MRILIHTQYYPPEIGAPQARLSELAQGLSSRGYEVSILTAFPNYPTGRIYPEFTGALVKKEVRSGITVYRSWIYPSISLKIVPRIFSYFSFVISSFIYGIFIPGKFDYVLTESPPLFLGITGFLLSKIKKAKWIFNISDLWPESALHLGVIRPGFFYTIALRLEKYIYKKAFVVTGQSKTIIADINNRYPQVQTYHLSNGVDNRLFNPYLKSEELRRKLAHQEEIIFFYGGLHGLAQGLDQILYAAKSACENCRFVFLGDGPEKKNLVKLAQELGLENIIFLEPIPKEQMPGYLASVDVCIVPLKMALPGAVPSKIYEAMAAEKPVLLVAEGEAAQIIQDANAGVVIDPGDIIGLANAIILLSEDPTLRKKLGRNGRKAVEGKFDREKIINNFSVFLEGIIYK